MRVPHMQSISQTEALMFLSCSKSGARMIPSMHKNLSELGAQPIGSFGHRMHCFGQSLLNRLPPEEKFLKTVPKDTPKVELVFPSSLNPRLVRRRLRYLAHHGSLFHQKLLYGSISLLPFFCFL
ncbi:hypothetical protein M758_2G093900 [Ceratodon purpureus]|nr:hypothetical protein M758_2G093900 [Ceratodon purpureus]